MRYNKVEICGVNTSQLKVLTEEQKRVLLLKVKNGDIRAREELINGNLKLVLSIIQRFNGRKENLDDLFQVGCIGLMKAIDNFNTELDVRFSTYAVPMIIGEIRRYLRDNNSIRVSRSVRDLAYRALQTKERLTASLEKEPTFENIATELNEKPENVRNALEAIVEPISIYEPIYNDSGDSVSLADQLSDGVFADEVWTERIALKEALKTLSEKELKIIHLRFYQGKTQSQIAELIGISQAQVSRIEKTALERLKKQM